MYFYLYIFWTLQILSFMFTHQDKKQIEMAADLIFWHFFNAFPSFTLSFYNLTLNVRFQIIHDIFPSSCTPFRFHFVHSIGKAMGIKFMIQSWGKIYIVGWIIMRLKY